MADNIERGKYETKYRPSMSTAQIEAEAERVAALFRADLLAAYDVHSPLGERFYRISWDALRTRGYRPVLDLFSEWMAKRMESSG